MAKYFSHSIFTTLALLSAGICLAEEPANSSSSDQENIAALANNQLIFRGFFFTGAADDVLPEGREGFTGVQIEDLDIPGGDGGLENIATPYLGKPINKEQLIALKQAIVNYYIKSKRPGIVVAIPRQKASSGIVQILITEKTLGKIIYKGAEWWSEDYLSQFIQVEPGEVIIEEDVLNDLAWLNQNPFHHSDLKYVAGSRPDEIDIEITTKDRFPIRFFATGDNTGNPATGNDRFSGGLTWGDAFRINDLLTYQYTTSNFPERYESHTGTYISYLPWKHTLMLFGNHTSVKIPTIPNFKVNAGSYDLRLRYTIPFKPLYTPFLQSLGFGFDVKYTNSNILNLATPQTTVLPFPNPIVQKLNISQLVGIYSLTNITGNHNYSLELDVYWAPFHFLKYQSDEDFAANRLFSKNKYAYAFLTIADTYTLPKNFLLASMLRIQKASTVIPNTELFSIGGYNTVRGYNESEFNSDNGLIVNLELRTPNISPFGRFSKKIEDQLVFLGFFDYGIGTTIHNVKALEGPATQYAMSVGPGVRYFINPVLAFRCDYGFKLHDLIAINSAQRAYFRGFGKWHLGLMLSY